MTILEQARQGAPLDDLLIIDCHAHYDTFLGFYFPRFPRKGITTLVDSLILAMDQGGVDIACLSSCLAFVSDPRIGNDSVAEAMAAHRDRVIGFAEINPNYPDQVERELTRCIEGLGMKGIKIFHGPYKYPLDGPNYQPVWEVANAHRLPVLIGDTGTEILGELAEQYPDAAFLRAHSGFRYSGARDCIEQAKRHPNFYLDLASAHMNLGLIEYIVGEIGADRVLFGTDIPLYDMRFCVGSILFARISDDDKRKIFGLNMQRLLERVGE